jgi:rubrerythrin
MAPVLFGAALVVASAIVAIAATRPLPPAQAASGGRSAGAVAEAPAPPRVEDTATNVKVAFGQEMNAKERYLVEAKRADFEGYPAVARLFRACARAEEAHAQRLLQAIASTGGYEARYTMERPVIATTAENLQTSIERERYEVEQFYPPLIEKARAEGSTVAVRGMTFALSAEREHLLLLTEAQGHLGQPDASRVIYVCPTCGKTVEGLEFAKCPTCFTSAKKFVRVV